MSTPNPEETEQHALAWVLNDAGMEGPDRLKYADAVLAAGYRRLSESEIRRNFISDAEVDAVAHVMFEPPTGGVGDYTWAEMVRDDPTRADIWRTDARAALEAARAAKEADRG